MISGNSEGLAECGSRCGRARNGISEAPGLDEHPKGIRLQGFDGQRRLADIGGN